MIRNTHFISRFFGLGAFSSIFSAFSPEIMNACKNKMSISIACTYLLLVIKLPLNTNDKHLSLH